MFNGVRMHLPYNHFPLRLVDFAVHHLGTDSYKEKANSEGIKLQQQLRQKAIKPLSQE